MVSLGVMAAAPGWLRDELVTLAWCWRLSRRDGVAIGLTSHDRDLVIAGLPYRAAPGMKPSAIETSDSLDVQTMDIEGAIASDAIAAGDLEAGRWDGAELELFVTDWTAPERAPVVVARGSLGAIECQRSGVNVSVPTMKRSGNSSKASRQAASTWRRARIGGAWSRSRGGR